MTATAAMPVSPTQPRAARAPAKMRDTLDVPMASAAPSANSHARPKVEKYAALGSTFV
jgi:hypothetical protein